MWIRSCAEFQTAARRQGARVAACCVLLGALAPPRTARGDERPLSLADAVATALTNNAELQVTRVDAGIAADQVLLSESVYDPTLSARVFAQRDETPASATGLGNTARQVGGETAISGRLITGMEYSLSAAVTSEKNSDPFSTVYDPAHSSSVTLSLVQPLLRGAWWAANRQVITVASLRRQQSDQLLRAQLERTVSAVDVAYWNLVRAHKEVEARNASLQLAVEQLGESRRLVRLGALSQLDVTEAEAGVSRRRQEVESAREDVAEAEGALLDVLQIRVGEGGWRADDVLVPTESPDMARVSASLEDHLAVARRSRPDLIAAQRLMDAEAAALDVAGNRVKPQVDLVARAGVAGFAGRLADNYATSGIDQTDGGLEPPYFSDPDFDGGLGTSLGNLVSGEHHGFYLGLRFELPLRNRDAEARYSIQQRELGRARVAHRALGARIENEVRTSLKRLQATAAIVTAADEAVAVTGRLLEGARRRFRNDASTSFDVLRIVDELTRSKIEAARARARYQIALSRLWLANGTLLQRREITIRSRAPGTRGDAPR